MNSNYPSIDPSDDAGGLVGAFRHILGKHQMSSDGKLPAQIISYNRATNRAVVQPLVKQVATNGTPTNRPQLASIPVYQIGGGGFILSFNLKAGDLGWIEANDRDISLFLQTYQMETPNSNRVKSFSDAVFYPDVMKGYTINSEDESNAVLQTLDGTTRIALFSDHVKITTPKVIIDSPSVTMSGTLAVTGAITSAESVTAPMVTGSTNVVFGGISGTGHVHSGVQTGSSNTGAAQ